MGMGLPGLQPWAEQLTKSIHLELHFLWLLVTQEQPHQYCSFTGIVSKPTHGGHRRPRGLSTPT